MKKFTYVLMALLCSALALSARADVTLVNNGKAAGTIYVSATPHPGHITKTPLLKAVTELNYAFEQMSGAKLPVVKTDKPAQVKGSGIVLGDLAVKMGATPQKTSVSKEGFRLLTKGNVLLIGGESDDGTLFGAYAFLRKLGCDWVMPGRIGEIYPKESTIKAPALDESQVPGFEFRELAMGGGRKANSPKDYKLYNQWARRSGHGDYTPPAWQGKGHYWKSFIRKHQKVFDAHPGMYALRRLQSGKLVRKGPQIETTNPRVISLFVQDIKDKFAKNNWPHDKAVGFPVGPADGGGFSVSVQSQEVNSGQINPISGRVDQTDLIVHLANQIWDRIKKDYPNVYLGYYSYSQYAEYPRRYKPNPHLVPIFAPIAFSRYHSFLDPHSKTQAYYRHILDQWHKLAQEQGNPLIYRGYNYDLAESMVPYSKVGIWGQELPAYQRMGFIGVNASLTKAWAIYAPSNYAFMRLAWNPSLSWKAVLHQYCQHAYGAGASFMEQYSLRLIKNQSIKGEEAGSYYAIPLIFTPKMMTQSEQDLKAAYNAAKTANDKTRISYVMQGFHSLQLYLKYFNATPKFDFMATKKYFQEMVDHQKAMLKENSALASHYGVGYLDRFLKQFVNQVYEYSTGKYHIVSKLPDALHTIFDPYSAGEEMHYFSPQINDSGWVKTKTYSTNWDAQGLAGLRDGSTWYHYRFALPDLRSGQSIGLLLGGFDDQAKVWLNGVPIGASKASFSRPATFDLSSAIKKKGDNLLAIEIVRNSKFNEVGTGGLMRPSFIFAGPRLKEQAAILPKEYLTGN